MNFQKFIQHNLYFYSLRRKAISFLEKKKETVCLLGSLNTSRLPILSFLIKDEETGLFLPHNFVTSLLNDLFGIQTRSGCQCAGSSCPALTWN